MVCYEFTLPTLGSNPGLLHCRQILYHLSHQGSLKPLIINPKRMFLFACKGIPLMFLLPCSLPPPPKKNPKDKPRYYLELTQHKSLNKNFSLCYAHF